MTGQKIRTSVVIPTVRRPLGLARAIESVLAQQGIDFADTEILVIDNDPGKSAETVVSRYGNAPVTVRYESEPEPGVANARNTAVRTAAGRLIAFLDDDQTAPAHWLAELLSCHETVGAAVTFGPVVTALPDDTVAHAAYLKKFFSRTGPATSGQIDTYYGCGNSLLDIEQMPVDRPLFDTKANETGGEDDFLFSRLKALGKTFAWAAGADVSEHVPVSRATLRYTLRRTFAYGQSPSTLCARRSPPNIPGVIFWTGVGIGQTLVYGLMSLFMMLVRAKRRAFWYDRTVQGLGKILWFGPFEQRFYGRHAV